MSSPGQKAARREGAMAAKKECARHINPYNLHTEERTAWYDGYDICRKMLEDKFIEIIKLLDEK